MKASDKLKTMLLENYSLVKQAYDQLATKDEKSKFMSIFDDFTEDEFQMGDWRVEMMLELIDDEADAAEKLASLETLLDQYAPQSAGQV